MALTGLIVWKVRAYSHAEALVFPSCNFSFNLTPVDDALCVPIQERKSKFVHLGSRKAHHEFPHLKG
jgi:hypothetical protein